MKKIVYFKCFQLPLLFVNKNIASLNLKTSEVWLVAFVVILQKEKKISWKIISVPIKGIMFVKPEELKIAIQNHRIIL